MPAADLRLLVLDGGGVRGLSSLMILRRLMAAVDPDAPPKPCDHFDMIGGTSTGGLIAIMLGRLRMSVDECIDAYTTLSDRVFEKKSHRVDIKGKLQGRFDSAALEQAVKDILVGRGLGEDALLKDTDSPCKVFVCATSKETSGTVCLASYRSPRSDNSDLLNATTIWQACRATSAATTFFDPIAIGPYKEEFVDGALGANNPVYALWNQAQDVWGAELRGLKCLVSIGTGVPALRPVRDDVLGIWATLKDLATETEETARQFHRDRSYLDDEGRYYRFNVDRGLEEIGLEESKKKKEIAAATRRYVESQAVFKQMKACANSIAGREYFGPYRTVFALQGAPASNRFVDRQSDTDELERCLLPRSRSLRTRRRIFVLYGLGGIGKTQLAVDFARRHKAAFSSVFWLDGRSEDHLRQSLAGYASKIPKGQIPDRSRDAGLNSEKDVDIATTAVESMLKSLPPCSCSNLVDDRTRGRHVDGVYPMYQASGRATVGPLSAPALPTRVIDLGTSDIVLGSNSLKLHLYLSSLDKPTFAHYATLSHRWGGRIPFMTTNSTFTRRVNGFWLDELPPSFQDAVLVARSLGLRYLWIDSLCIVQDDEADWFAQSQQMGRIFANASVTIAAHSAQDSTQGFLASFLVPGLLRIRPEDPSGGFTIPTPELSSDALLLKRFSRSCLNSRAWVMQELCLSPRILHFLENRVLWECVHTPLQIGAASPPTWAALLLQGRRSQLVGANPGEARYNFWRELITQYSACQMTNAGDKLVAVAGIAEQLNSFFASSLSYNYHCGIFNADVARSILWYSSQAPKPLQKPRNRAPTWSWASADGRLAFAASPDGADVTSCVVFRSITPKGVCQNTIEMAPCEPSFTPPSTCSLVIDGPIIERQHVVRLREASCVALTPQNGPQVVGTWTHAGSSTPQADIAWEIIDSEAEIDKAGKPSKIRCVVVSSMSLGNKFLGAWMLLLSRHTSSPKTYKRVGLGCLLDESIFNMANREVLTVV